MREWEKDNKAHTSLKTLSRVLYGMTTKLEMSRVTSQLCVGKDLAYGGVKQTTDLVRGTLLIA